jgi:hypothetical protein
MVFCSNGKKPLAMVLVVTLISMSAYWVPARAAMLGTAQVLKENTQDLNRDRLRGFLEREEVQAQLQSWGVDSETAKARVDSLTDEEVSDIVARLDTLPAGGDAFGALIGVAFLVFIILLVTDLLGLTDVFPFVKKNR